MTRKQKKRKKPIPTKSRKTHHDHTEEWIPSAEETFEENITVPAARLTRQHIENVDNEAYYPLGVSIRLDLYIIRLMFPKIPKNKAVNLWFNPNGILLPLRELLNTHTLPSLIGQPSYSRFAGQIQARILKTSAAELIEQFWSKVVKDNMYKMSKNGKRVLYSEPMFNILTRFIQTVHGRYNMLQGTNEKQTNKQANKQRNNKETTSRNEQSPPPTS